jgi:histidine triad (HIT) family protein
MSETRRADDCLFCRMVAGEPTPDIVLETDSVLAFRDINPQAPVHVLVIPKVHVPDLAALAREEPAVAVDVMNAMAAVAEQEGLAAGYRVVFNTGADANQVVFHAHGHVLGGRGMHWPPG